MSRAAQAIEVPKESPDTRVTLDMWLPGGELEYVQTVAGGNDHYLVSASGGTPRKICEGRGASGGDGCQTLNPDWDADNHAEERVRRRTDRPAERQRRLRAPVDPGSGLRTNGARVLS